MHLIILAGGRNSRIQTKKALLSVGGRPIIERIITRLQPVVEGCLIVTGDPEAYAFTGAPTTADRYPGKGPLGGLEAGLAASPAELNLVVACDLPFVSAELAAHLGREAEAHPEADALVPSWEKGQEPLFAVYRKRAAGALAGRLESGDLRLGRLNTAISVLEIEVTEWARRHGVDLQRAFWNVNTWEEWREAEAAAQREAAEAVREGSPPLLAVVGWQEAGKTSVTSALVREFSRTGLRVAVVKHDPHGHETDTPGKDTYVHRESGAEVTVLAGPQLVTTWWRVKEPLSLAVLVRQSPPVDLVLAEGWKGEPVPRVVVVRPEARGDGRALLGPGEVLAVVGEGEEARRVSAALATPVPVFAPGETAALATHLRQRLGLGEGS
ncbi:MAG: molybdopterin-guanine dinucleotide biosynthesis protein B [Bacillota bacterium]|nr:molybdopterin-guanine dinucleotide biosynthesis protein B [Bacillota bacterium]